MWRGGRVMELKEMTDEQKTLVELDKLTDDELIDEMTEHGMPLIYRLAITHRFKVKELEKENENLKCCGNCVDSVDSLEGTLCDFWKQTIYCGGYERCWQTDNKTRKEREHEPTKLRKS